MLLEICPPFRGGGGASGRQFVFMSNWTRPYQEEDSGEPSLHYAAFGDVFQLDESEEVLSLIHPEIEVEVVEAELLRQGPLWELLRESDSALANLIEQESKATVIRGKLPPQKDLEYLRIVIDVLTYMVDSGAQAIFDPYSSRWWDSDSWDEMATAGQVFNPFDHCQLVSKAEAAKYVWLHTRGLLKFGRPDLSVRGVDIGHVESVSKMLHRFVNFQALGGVIEMEREIEMEGLEQTYIPSSRLGSLREPFYENTLVEFSVQGSESLEA